MNSHFTRGARVGVILILAMSLMAGAVSAQMLLDPVTHPKFVNPLPIPGRLDFTGGFRGALQIHGNRCRRQAQNALTRLLKSKPKSLR